MPSLPPRLLIGLYATAAVIAVGALLTSPTPTTPVATVATEIVPVQNPPIAYNIFPVADDRATTTPTTLAAVPAQPASIAAALVSPTPTQPNTVVHDQSTVNTKTRAALVNIFCTPKKGGPVSGSGSGIIVDSRGVILTNAHVAQFLLLQEALPEGQIDCVVRTGSPAKAAYYAKPLYVSTAWIDANASKIADSHATGNGEHDYAFLLITRSIDAEPPSTFPYVQMTTNKPNRGDGVLLAGYPAGFLDSTIVQKGLYITSSFTTVEGLFAFDDQQRVDLVSVGGTVVSQSGASGGSVVRQNDGALLAVIATASDAANTASRDLRAITVAHINRSLAAEGKGGIVALLTGDLSQKAEDFKTNTAPALAKKLLDTLRK